MRPAYFLTFAPTHIAFNSLYSIFGGTAYAYWEWMLCDSKGDACSPRVLVCVVVPFEIFVNLFVVTVCNDITASQGSSHRPTPTGLPLANLWNDNFKVLAGSSHWPFLRQSVRTHRVKHLKSYSSRKNMFKPYISAVSRVWLSSTSPISAASSPLPTRLSVN